MIGQVLVAGLDDEDAIFGMSTIISRWEPALDLLASRANPMIYEPDGTLYAASLSPRCTLLARHKLRLFEPGDVAVIPQSTMIEAERPGASYAAVLHRGTPPYHFRERFIQTWGFEHRSHQSMNPCPDQFDVIPEDDPRFRLPYRLYRLKGDEVSFDTGLHIHLWIGLQGSGSISLGPAESPREYSQDDLILVGQNSRYSIEGRGLAGRFLIRSEHESTTILTQALARRGAELGSASWLL